MIDRASLINLAGKFIETNRFWFDLIDGPVKYGEMDIKPIELLVFIAWEKCP